VTVAPTPAATLEVTVGGGPDIASILFTANISRVDSIKVHSSGSARIATGAHPGEKTLIAHSLSITSDGRFDLGNGRLIIDYTGTSPLPDIRSYIIKGYTGGITGDRAFDPTMTVACVEAGELLRITGNQTGLINGQTMDATSIVVMPTKAGDANLDGRVNFIDFQRFETGYGLENQGWGHGDFNLDGVVDTGDLKLLYDNYGKIYGLASAPVPADELAAISAFARSVPEPMDVSLLGVAGILLGRRRRCRLAR
jgi:hypothetical protein